MPEVPRQSSAPVYARQLELAAAYARELDQERAKSVGPLDTRTELGRLYDLRADQGHALRELIYHCTAAIVAAVREP